MTIKEIEALSAMTRANIRFYESEGLLSPERSSNGYRDYSENDLEVLKRIKLLRTLHISLDEIKSLHTGEQELVDALDRHLAKLESEKADIEQSQDICRVMRSAQCDIKRSTLSTIWMPSKTLRKGLSPSWPRIQFQRYALPGGASLQEVSTFLSTPQRGRAFWRWQ